MLQQDYRSTLVLLRHCVTGYKYLKKCPALVITVQEAKSFMTLLFELSSSISSRQVIFTLHLYAGVIRTELGRNIGGRYQNVFDLLMQLLTPITWFFVKNLDEGAQTTIYLASDIHLDNVTGKYFRFSFIHF